MGPEWRYSAGVRLNLGRVNTDLNRDQVRILSRVSLCGGLDKDTEA